jgi:miniconductance mechanosensitive channel
MSIFTYNVVKLKIISDKVNNLYNFAQLNNSYPMHLSNDRAIWLKEIKYPEPEGNGLLLRVYAYSSEISRVTFEHLQSEINEHPLSVFCESGLKVFQLPTGEDLVAISETKEVFICLIPKN